MMTYVHTRIHDLKVRTSTFLNLKKFQKKQNCNFNATHFDVFLASYFHAFEIETWNDRLLHGIKSS